MNKPIDGPLTKYGPYLRNAQEIAPGLFMCESQRGTKGKGKVWTPIIFRAESKTFCATVTPQRGKYATPGYVKASVWWSDDLNRRHSIDAYLPTEQLGIAFILRIAPEYVS